MSESEKKENCTIESNNIDSENAEQCNSMENSAVSLNESQDFHLVDFEDDDSLDKEEKPREEERYTLTGSVGGSTDATTEHKLPNSDEDKTSEKKDVQNEHTLEVTKEKPRNDNNVLCDMEKLVDDEDKDEEEEIIQCTPPQDHSPSKIQIYSGTGVTSLKRKAGSFDEPPNKILRTLSNEDALMRQEEETRDEEEEEEVVEASQFIKTDDTQQDFSENCVDTNLIIAETQDMAEDDVLESTIGISMNVEEPTKDSTTLLESQVKEVDKTDNCNDALVSSEFCTNKETEQVDKVEKVEKLYDENEMNKSDLKKDGISSSKAITIEKVTLDENTRDTMDSNPIQPKDSDVNAENTKVENTDEKGYCIDQTKHTSPIEKTNEREETLNSKNSTNESCSNVISSNAKHTSPIEKTNEAGETLNSKNSTNESCSNVISSNAKHTSPIEKTIETEETLNSKNSTNESCSNVISSNAKHISPIEKTNEKEETLNSKNSTNESCSNVISSNPAIKSRMSVEVIYDKTMVQEIKPKSRELVEIDEDGEKIVLDSSQEDSDTKTDSKNSLDDTKAETIYKSCYDTKSSSEFSYKSVGTGKESSLDSIKSGSKLVNGSTESKRCDTDSTASLQSDTFNDIPVVLVTDKSDNNISASVQSANKQTKAIASLKDSDHVDLLLSVSDNEPDVFIMDEKSKSISTHSSSMAKALQVEKEIGIYVRMKCLLQVDEGTKEFLSKEITGVQCEPVGEPTLIRQKNNDTSASLADISGNDNKDASPGSINSNPQMYPLNTRLSFASTISSISSVSSAASLAAKLAARDSTHFSLPRVPAKHAKKHIPDMHPFNDKQSMDEAYERLNKEWQNSRLVTTSVLNFVNAELLASIDTYNVSNERIDDQLQKIRSSTPEAQQEVAEPQTPRTSKKGKPVKRPRSKNAKLDSQSNGLNKISLKTFDTPAENIDTPSKKKSKTEYTEQSASGTVADTDASSSKPSSFSQTVVDDLIRKTVFAKWSDNNYYPGTVIDKVKTKYKVNFYDGKNKLLIEDFIITIPKVLKEGLSVYATTSNDDYGSCGIIVDVNTVNNEVYYTVETDEGEKLKVQVKDIFLSSDQAQVLKEEMSSDSKSLLLTPKHLGQVSLDNMVDGKRRSRRIGTPVFSTPKSKSSHSQHTPGTAVKNIAEPSLPSVSGMASTLTKDKKPASESDGVSSDSNVSIKDEISSIGVQPEIIGTPHEQIVKGPQSRIKSKPRSKKKVDDEQTIATFGPIPSKDSNLFKGMSFILTCAPLDTLDRYQSDIKDCSSDPGTENEEEWSKKPFVSDRLIAQISAGNGKVYTDFNDIPENEYKSTKLITNVPNTTAKALLCLSVGIPAYNHNWIIRCCQEGKIVNPAEDELPAGWSLDKKSYVEMFQRPGNKPLTEVVVIIPNIESEKLFITFWRKICENAGAVVLLADKPDTMEGFGEGTVVLTNRSCPSWVTGKASELQMPLLSTTWVVQCLIEGKFCRYDIQRRYKYNYTQN
ncbi:uncharacterized protein LOC143214149 [Lasioglossum baleicum]|uniref:uncharacterized protein LOC143214149 n=1 Tax=Lasioglossum baleicum TaxID=434251 RepID=UPI003FCE3467